MVSQGVGKRLYLADLQMYEKQVASLLIHY